MNTTERFDIEIGGKPYNVSKITMPYFASYLDFQNQSGQAVDKHGEIPSFDAAYQGAESGFRQCFRALGTDLTEYNTLCDTLDFLCVDTLGGRSTDAVIQDLKSGREDFIEKGDKATARDSAFRLLYLLLKAELEDEGKVRQKMYQAVLFVVSHRAIFKYRARRTIREAYEERCDISMKQRAALDKWPVLEPGTATTWSDRDVTTEDSSDYDFDSDGS